LSGIGVSLAGVFGSCACSDFVALQILKFTGSSGETFVGTLRPTLRKSSLLQDEIKDARQELIDLEQSFVKYGRDLCYFLTEEITLMEQMKNMGPMWENLGNLRKQLQLETDADKRKILQDKIADVRHEIQTIDYSRPLAEMSRKGSYETFGQVVTIWNQQRKRVESLMAFQQGAALQPLPAKTAKTGSPQHGHGHGHEQLSDLVKKNMKQ